ncbi:universal stress protein [Streptomyces vinaceus]|uniref:universal stress protein n=1 Tax=Streptomyces vinaceus TaxID=1960 RepID=UPI00380E370F
MEGLAAQRVIVGVSDSPGCLVALRRGYREAVSRGAELHVVHVCTLPAASFADGYALAMAPDPGLLWEMARVTLETACRNGLGRIPDDVPFQAIAIQGIPGRTLGQYADRPDDLVIVGSGTPRRRFGRRTVHEECVRETRGEVLVVPRPELERDYASGSSWSRRRRQRDCDDTLASLYH